MDIKPYTKNAKKHPDKQLKQIANSLREFGWQQPIVVDKNGTIIVGHGRWFAYQKYPEGIKEPEIKVADLTEEQAKAYRLADNKLNESEWDIDLAIEDLKELSDEMFDLTGFDKDLLIEPDEQDDVIPENPPVIAKLGDIWQLGRHRLMCGDSTKIEDVEKLMDGKKADMVFTDPPYGVGFKYNNHKDHKNYEAYKEFCFKWLDNLKKFSDFIVITTGHKNKKLYYEYDNNLNELVWIKKNGHSPGFISYILGTEPIIVYGRLPNKRRYDTDYFEETIKIQKDLEDKHSCPKPIGLLEKIIVPATEIKMVILDLFGGSGSTLIACEKTNRICYMSELDPKYVSVILQRWADYTGQDPVREDGFKWSEICKDK